MMNIRPMLATLIDKPFDKKGWLFEIKWDGYRAIAIKNKTIELRSRNQKSLNSKFPSIAAALKKLPGEMVLDGEIVVLDKKGKSNFQLLQNYQRKPEGALYYCIFDVLSYKGKDLTGMPLIQRKALLKKILTKQSSPLRFSDHIEEKGKAFFRLAAKQGLEGIMAKKEDSPYEFRRSKDWLKIKTKWRQEVVIGGYTEPKGSRKRFGALLLGVYDKGNLRYVGHVGGGFDEKLLEEIYKQLGELITTKCPFITAPKPNTPATWVKPKLVCEVAFAEWTSDGKMRQPIFQGMRIDKNAKDVVRERLKKVPIR